MTNHESDGLFDNEGDDRGELYWTEAEWQKYLAEQEKNVTDYAEAYEKLPPMHDRIDRAAKQLGWESSDGPGRPGMDAESPESADRVDGPWEPYTLHRNPVYIATKAIFSGLNRDWDQVVIAAETIPGTLVAGFFGGLRRGEEASFHGVQALEMGDYTLGLCYFKRGMRELNILMSLLQDPAFLQSAGVASFGESARPRLFDIREIWLRVMNECRIESELDDGDN